MARYHDGETKEHAIGHVSKTFGAGRDTLRALLEEYDPLDLVRRRPIVFYAALSRPLMFYCTVSSPDSVRVFLLRLSLHYQQV
jgi:hypothetical protein